MKHTQGPALAQEQWFKSYAIHTQIIKIIKWCRCGVQTPAYPGKGPCQGEALRKLGVERGSLGGKYYCWTLLS